MERRVSDKLSLQTRWCYLDFVGMEGFEVKSVRKDRLQSEHSNQNLADFGKAVCRFPQDYRFLPPLRTLRPHQRNLRSDPLQLLLRGHQIVAVSRSHKSFSRPIHSAGSRHQAHKPSPDATMQHSSAPAHKAANSPLQAHRHSRSTVGGVRRRWPPSGLICPTPAARD